MCSVSRNLSCSPAGPHARRGLRPAAGRLFAGPKSRMQDGFIRSDDLMERVTGRTAPVAAAAPPASPCNTVTWNDAGALDAGAFAARQCAP